MDKKQLVKKIPKDINKLVKSNLFAKFEAVALEVQQAIINQYDEDLVDVVTDRKSKTNPNLYRDEFIERLQEFEYAKRNGNTVTISTPDMENFDFSGRLKVIESIMNGLSGLYVEVNEEDYVRVFGKKPVNQEPVDEYVPPKERIYLVKYSSRLKKAEKEIGKKFVRYPFSNTPPIDVLSAGDKYVEENVNKWIDESIKKAEKIFISNYKGDKL